MHILLTNDDGINAPGLHALYEALKDKHDISIVAPEHEQSATSHRLTIIDPLRAKKVNFSNDSIGYAVDGTPADCVKLGISKLISRKPDWVISGINPGANIGFNVFYSGTVAAARESVAMGIPSMAVSIANGKIMDYTGAAQFICQLLEKISKQIFPFGSLLNVNFPNGPVVEAKGVRLARQAIYHLYELYQKRTDPRKEDYYWLEDESFPITEELTTDFGTIENNYITLSPITIDTTDEMFLNHMKHWDLTIENNIR
ncbi:5'-nucleotidase [Candidatus Magnetomorum sp. HK-1]|nr:5'-nucleotidase [Candidatus Magnetomorum sp. HK-1]